MSSFFLCFFYCFIVKVFRHLPEKWFSNVKTWGTGQNIIVKLNSKTLWTKVPPKTIRKCLVFKVSPAKTFRKNLFQILKTFSLKNQSCASVIAVYISSNCSWISEWSVLLVFSSVGTFCQKFLLHRLVLIIFQLFWSFQINLSWSSCRI